MIVRRAAFWALVALLLVPALVLTFSRLVEPLSAFWLMVEAFTPLGALLYAAAAVVVGTRLLRSQRWWTWVAAGTAVVGLALHAWWFAPQVLGGSPAPGEGAQRLTVMTVNIAQEDGDAAELVRIARQQHVDLLAVQEITTRTLADMRRAGIDDVLPHSVGRAYARGTGTMLFSAEPLGPATRTTTSHDGWEVRVGGVTVVATHVHVLTRPAVWSSDLAALLRMTAHDRPDLMVGDFNATEDHAPMRALASAGYRDAGELANQGWQPTWPARDRWPLLPSHVVPLAQIDHVLVGPQMASLGQHVVRVPGSDHRALMAEVARR